MLDGAAFQNGCVVWLCLQDKLPISISHAEIIASVNVRDHPAIVKALSEAGLAVTHGGLAERELCCMHCVIEE